MRVLADWLLTPQRVAVHLPSATAVAADLHLGYGLARRRGGEAVPVRPLAEHLAPLEGVIGRHEVGRLVVAGDLLEDGRHGGEGEAGLAAQLLAWLGGVGCELAGVVPGNHDRGLGKSALPLFPEGFTLGEWRVVHGDAELPAGPLVQGHEHPWVRWTALLSGPCYLAREGHLVLPAFSPDAAGVNVLGARRWAGHRCYVVAGDAILDFGEVGRLQRRGP
jgi:metallophosphoesterase superfamily enzyme